MGMFDYEVKLITTTEATMIVRAKSIQDAEDIASSFFQNKIIIDVVDDPAIEAIDSFTVHEPDVEEVIELVDD